MRKLILLLFCLTLFSASIVCGEYLIVVNKENPISKLHANEVKYIYLMKKRAWADGTQILPLDLLKRSKVRESFSQDILKKTPSTMAKYYFKRALSGKGQPPKTYQTEEEIIDYITRNVGAIGYISKSNPAVKTVDIISKK